MIKVGIVLVNIPISLELSCYILSLDVYVCKRNAKYYFLSVFYLLLPFSTMTHFHQIQLFQPEKSSTGNELEITTTTVV